MHNLLLTADRVGHRRRPLRSRGPAAVVVDGYNGVHALLNRKGSATYPRVYIYSNVHQPRNCATCYNFSTTPHDTINAPVQYFAVDTICLTL